MVKTSILSILHYNKFTFGDQVVSQFIIFEFKYLFSIILFYFHKSNGEQDRYHTHAFNAISFKFFGSYDEYILDDETTGKYHVENRKNIIKYFPRDRFHKIGKSTGCLTLLLAGKWNYTWKEYICGSNDGNGNGNGNGNNNGNVLYYTYGRKVIQVY